MRLIVNGESETGAHANVEELLAARGIDPKVVVVELNGRALAQADFRSASLSDGDQLEIVQFVAGG